MLSENRTQLRGKETRVQGGKMGPMGYSGESTGKMEANVPEPIEFSEVETTAVQGLREGLVMGVLSVSERPRA